MLKTYQSTKTEKKNPARKSGQCLTFNFAILIRPSGVIQMKPNGVEKNLDIDVLKPNVCGSKHWTKCLS